MAKNISISLAGIVATIPAQITLNHFFYDEDKTRCTFYGTRDMSSSEIRKQLTELALFLSDQGFFCSYNGGKTLDASLAPADTANVPSSKEEPTFAMLARIFDLFSRTTSPDGHVFLINKNNLSQEKMKKVVAELESRKFNAEYYTGSNFIILSASDELETFFTSVKKTDEKKNISVSANEEAVSGWIKKQAVVCTNTLPVFRYRKL